MVITESMDTQSVQARVGAILIVQLSVQMGTGSNWQPPKELPPFLALRTDTLSASTGMPGAAQMREWTYAVNGPGTVTMKFEYRRPWLLAEPPIKTFAITIVAQ